jgi:hypothetical protein
MEKLMTKQNLMYAGITLLTAIIVYKLIVNYSKPTTSASNTTPTTIKSTDESSSFCGCGA